MKSFCVTLMTADGKSIERIVGAEKMECILNDDAVKAAGEIIGVVEIEPEDIDDLSGD